MHLSSLQRRIVALGTVLFCLAVSSGCERAGPPTVWHEQILPSGSKVKITSLYLTWGIEHEERFPSKDSFAIEYVGSSPALAVEVRDREAREVFELIRSPSEQMALTSASVSAFPTLQRKGHYDLYVFQREKDGRWSSQRHDSKVFVND